MKKPLIASGVLVALLIMAAFIAPSFIDWNSHRPEVTEAVHKFTGLDISVEGDLSFRLLPSPALSARALTLANVEGGAAQYFLDAEGLDINVDIFSLLGGDIRVGSVVLDTPLIALERDAAGDANWDLILAGGKDGERSDRDVSLDHFVIKDGTIIYRDAASGRHEELTGINATISAKSISGPLESSGAFGYRGVALSVDAAIGRMQPGRRTALRVTVAVAGQSPGITFNGSALLDEGAQDFSGRLTGGGSDLGALLDGLARLTGGGFEAPVNLAHGYGLDADVAVSEEAATIEPITFKVGSTTGEGRLVLGFGETMTADASAAVTTVKLEEWLPAAADAESGASGSGEGAFTLPANVEGKLQVTVGAVEYREGIARQISLVAGLKDQRVTLEEARALLPGGSDLVLTGVLSAKDGAPAFAGRLRAASNNLRGLAAWLGYDTTHVPEGQMANFALDGALGIGGDRAWLSEAKASLDITEATGSVSIGRGEAAGFTVDVAFNRLNLDAYMPPPGQAGGGWQEATDGIRAALKPLAGMSAEVKLKGDQVTLSGASIAGVVVDAGLKNGALTLRRLALASFEGVRFDVRGRLGSLAKEPRGNLMIDIESPNLTRFVRWSDMDLPMPAAGLSRVVVKGKLNGTMRDVEIDLSGVAARGAYRVKGTLAGLSPAPAKMTLEFEAGHSSHVDMIRRLNLPLEIAGEGQTTRIYGTLEGAPDDLGGKVRIEALGAKGSIEGRYAGLMGAEGAPQSFDLAVGLSHPEMSQLVRYFDPGFAPAGGTLGAVKAALTVKGTNKDFTLADMQARLGPTALRGKLRVNRTTARTNITGALKAGSLPLDSFMGETKAGARQAASGGERWSRKAVDFSALRDFDMVLEFAADEVGLRDFLYKEASMTVNLNNGVLTIPHLRSGLYDGTAAMDIRLDATTDRPLFTLGLDLRDVDMEPFMRAATGIPAATGRMGLAGQFTGAGKSQFAMISSLAGQAQFLARDGVIRKLNAGGILRALGGALNPMRLGGLLDRAARDGETPYGQIETAITVDKGIVHFAPTETITGEGHLLRGGGLVDLPGWTVSLDGEIRFADMHALPPVPFRLSGKLDDPGIDFRWSQLIAQVVKNAGANVLRGAVGAGKGLKGLTDLAGSLAPLPLVEKLQSEGSGAAGEDSPQSLTSLIGKAKGGDEQEAEDEDNGGN